MKNKFKLGIASFSLVLSSCFYTFPNLPENTKLVDSLEKKDRSLFVKKDSSFIKNELYLAEFYLDRTKYDKEPENSLHDYEFARRHYKRISNNYENSAKWCENKGIYLSNINGEIKFLDDILIPTTEDQVVMKRRMLQRDWETEQEKNTVFKNIFSLTNKMVQNKFMDIHCHLDACKNIQQVVLNATQNDVIIFSAGTSSESNRKLLELKKEFPILNICLGIYPAETLKMSDSEMNEELKFIYDNRDRISAIGEVGLDLHEARNIDFQKKNLAKFVFLAKKLNKPIIIHSRDAELTTVEFLEQFDYKKIIMHCFSGSMKLVERIGRNGWSLSIPASVKYNEHFQKVIENTPIYNLFCETDSPFLHPDRQMDNEPANVIASYEKIAEIKGLTIDEIREKIFENYKRVFG